MKNSRQKQIEQQIEMAFPGSVFVLSDFTDIASPKTVSKVLTRLSDAKHIERTMRGVFWKPDGITPEPHPDDVARALARGNIWRVAPCGETALHMAGLMPETPKEWTYVTDGTYRRYCFNGHVISFRHASAKTFGSMSEKTVLLVQVLRAYGEKKISEDLLDKLRTRFKPEETKRILEETRHTTAWISKTIRTMFRKKEFAG